MSASLLVFVWLLGGVVMWHETRYAVNASDRWLAVTFWPAVAVMLVGTLIFDFFHSIAHKRRALAALAVAFLAGSVYAEDRNAAPAELYITTGVMMPMTGETPVKAQPEAFIDVEVPLPIGSQCHKDADGRCVKDSAGKEARDAFYLGRVYARLGIKVEPGESVNFGDPQNYKGAEFGAGLARVVGYDGEVEFSLVAEIGFGTRFSGTPDPVDKLTRYFGFGVRLKHRSIGALTVILGKDEAVLFVPTTAVGPPPDRVLPDGTQINSYGWVGIPETRGIMRIIGGATVNVSRPAATQHSPALPRQIDLFALGAEVDGAQIFRLLTKDDAPQPPENTRRPEISRPQPSSAMGPPAPSPR